MIDDNLISKPTELGLAPLFGALAAAQASIQAVGKDGKNSHQNYAYTTSEAVIDAARVALAPQGLAAFRVRYDIPDKSIRSTNWFTQAV